MIELLHCPSCDLTGEKFKDHKKLMESSHLSANWDNYKPIIYRCRFSSLYLIECQNCGMTISFGVGNKEEDCIKLWNDLPRKK